VRAWVLGLLLASGVVAAAQAQEAPTAPAVPEVSATDKAAHALMQDTLVEAERWLLEYFVQPGTDVPSVVLKDFEKLDSAVQESYFRDLAQRSGMLLFVTREEVRLVQERRKAAETAQRLLRESLVDRRRERRRRTTATLFWTSLGTAIAGFAGSYGCWYLSDYLDQRYLSSVGDQAALFHAWSKLLQSASYASAGVGALGITIALPALAGMRSR
jgi:hypothetical protein